MDKVIFKNDVKSFFAVAGLGILAGLLVDFFSLFPAHTLWGLAWFSSSTFGFWFFTVSPVALFSAKNYSAGLHTAAYVYFMFFVTGIGKAFNNEVYACRNGWDYEVDVWEGLLSNLLLYGMIPAIFCGILGFVLWYGRKKKLPCVIMRFAPALFIALDGAACLAHVITEHERLFVLLVDALCAVAYVWIIYKNSEFD